MNMFSAIASLLWGVEQDTSKEDSTTVEHSNLPDDSIELENEWIFVQPKVPETCKRRRQAHFSDDGLSTASESNESVTCGMEESWLVEPPSCFSSKRRQLRKHEIGPMENLLIEHPSMSIYKESNSEDEEISTDVPVEKNVSIASGGCSYRAIAGRLQKLEQRVPLKDMSSRRNSQRRFNSPKNIKRSNHVQVRQAGSRANKQFGRMSGKHVGMVGKRAA